MQVDIFDTQIWVYAANNSSLITNSTSQQYSKAVNLYNEVIDEDRAVYIPRYIIAEFYNAMDSINRADSEENAIKLHKSLDKSDTAFIPVFELGAHNPYRKNVSVRRRQPETTALAEALEMEAKDAPIIGVAQRLPKFVQAYDPPNHGNIAIPQEYEEYQLITALQNSNISEISTRIITYENDFVGVDPLPLDDVSIKKISD
ncbi:hypothetical protein QA600_15050 [Natronococcus sp. A-GB1]|uniref:hypothetical protein n=1 Tax=Natronococcus sp. A-GB1 TaxID=3037648 RepID=UPI00241FEBF7|nr:hypothetical protein [Natronococcus sp. A-GB1]MDG5760652.1 hypothetical protein [Natronococcus sp. A-GB1]